MDAIPFGTRAVNRSCTSEEFDSHGLPSGPAAFAWNLTHQRGMSF